MDAPGPDGERVLVTGGAGFVGSHLADALVEDNDVTVVDSLASGDLSRVPEAATFREVDVRDEAAIDRAVADADLVYHQAALVSVDRSIEAPTLSHEINVDATLALLEAARRHDVRVVLASSAAIYGQPERTPIAEDHPKEPASPYGLDKLTVDHYARQYHELYGLETVALRYFNVYGPGQPPGDYAGVISVFVDQARTGGPITVHGDGAQTRDFVHVDDVVRANLLAGTTDGVGAAYNVGTGSSITIRELAERVREATGGDAEIVHTEPREGDVERSVASIERVRSRLGYEPQVDFGDGLRRTVAWVCDQ